MRSLRLNLFGWDALYSNGYTAANQQSFADGQHLNHGDRRVVDHFETVLRKFPDTAFVWAKSLAHEQLLKSDVAVQTLEKCKHPVVEAPKAGDVPGRTFMEALVEHFAA
ncbi:hypothetical protein FRACYDRAFT_240471 [Fragilariopsis cylindrus CCMP1102]|uniref:Uncharacterized protein n=1 Tax=Fragilariopsis cylindrus CCMP1102 TaxID=635003 RepID=A0A1E7FCJ8_9STRA|nr:hypothetical protein FRACYDRAFT_240471 [Fragilariopsis cylindrus CCMP1102]|eukprot:OEU15775.1 hypothetical protein FRACYDRAFT_240471 [Fragilariopsis cylindrus CCMP1102]